MDDNERDRIRQEARDQADLLSRVRSLEADQKELVDQNKTLVGAVASLTMKNHELEKGLKEALDHKHMMDRYKAWAAWTIVLGAAALIFRPVVNMWEKILSLFGAN